MASLDAFENEETTVSFLAGQTIFKEGDPGDLMYVLQEGEVDVLVHDKLIETIGPGSIMGEMALLDGTVRSATAIAKTDCKLVPYDVRRFQIHVQSTPYFAIQVMRVMADRLRRMLERF